MNGTALVSLGCYFLLMLGIGLYAQYRSDATLSGYLLGGRQLGPAVTALSAGASDMSAWIMMGLPGAMFATGLGSAWIAVGLVLGAWANWLLLAPRLRHYSTAAGIDALTLPDYFAARFPGRAGALRLLAALVIIIFFTLYTAAGLVAGGVLFETIMGLPFGLGLGLTLLVVVAYTLLGGFHAVCLTDFVQGTLMLVALLLVPLVAFGELGSVAVLVSTVEQVNPEHFDWLRGLGVAALLSNLAWGLGYFGQPHIVVRFMAIRSVEQLPTARRIGMSWMTLSLLGALATGLVGVAWVQQRGLVLDDPERIFILMSQLLFHPLVAGVLVAAILAAIMSTVSSQLLVAASSLGADLYRGWLRRSAAEAELLRVSRAAVLLVALVAAWLALGRDSSILDLVGNAWAGFGAAFGPVLLFSLLWPGMSANGALAGMVVGAVVVLAWISLPVLPGGLPLGSWLYEMIPGFLCSALAIYLASKLRTRPNALE